MAEGIVGLEAGVAPPPPAALPPAAAAGGPPSPVLALDAAALQAADGERRRLEVTVRLWASGGSDAESLWQQPESGAPPAQPGEPSVAPPPAALADQAPGPAAANAESLAPPPSAASSGLTINLSWDNSALNAPDTFRSGVEQAAAIIEGDFTSFLGPITINIRVGYGEWNNQQFGLTNTSLGGSLSGSSQSYQTVLHALTANARSPLQVQGDAALPDTGSLQGESNFLVASGEEKALGLIAGNASAMDGAIGIGTGSGFTGNGLIAAALHEITHAMGRQVGGEPLDFFRFTAPGQRLFTSAIPAPTAYFSTDGGVTDMADFGVNSDPADFLTGGVQDSALQGSSDAFDEGGGMPLPYLTPADVAVMNVLGFQPPGNAPTVSPRNISVPVRAGVAASSAIASVSAGSVSQYVFEDLGNGGGYFSVNGAAEPAGREFFIAAAALGGVQYVGGPLPGSETVAVAVLDGTTGIYSNFSYLTATTTRPPSRVIAMEDFNGDGRADVVLQNAASGQAWLWEMSGTAIIGGGNVATPGAGWRVAGQGDFNGDGHADIVLQNQLSGQIWVWEMNGNAIVGGNSVGTPGPGWQVKATGDFDGDGKSDILLQNEFTGQIWLWQMNGTAIVGGGNVATPRPGWQVVTAGDVNDDGRADIVLQDAASGSLWIYEMSGNAIIGGGGAGNPGPGWRAVATADFNGDGYADLVLQNSMTGAVGADLMTGNDVLGFAAIGTAASPLWHVAAADDFTGNGNPDILLQNGATSQSWMWTLNGTAISGGGAVATPGAGWQVTAGQPPAPAPDTRDYNADGRADVVLHNDGSGQSWLWEMNGAAIIGGGNIATLDPSWQVAGQGDFGGDGLADILLQNSGNFAVWLWQMNANAIVGGGAVATAQAGWQVAGTGDFDGDGRADILLQNPGSGQMWMWLMNGNTIVGGGGVANSDPSWRVAATADLNGDGKADIVLQNGGTGALWVDEMNGNAIIGGGSAGNPGAGWQVAGAADFNHDGMADLVLQNTQTGEVGVDEMSGNSVLGFVDIGTPAAGYTVKSVADYTGGGSPDLVLQNDATSGAVLWTLAGTTLAAATDIGSPGPGWHIPTA